MIRIIRNNERYHFESGWLSTYWHFSFDHYYDPANINFGPLRVFNDDRIQPESGFPTHGHREMEIITYVLEGELEHKDSTGGAGRIRAGEVQRMSAGTGIRHSEYNPSHQPLHLLQIWIEPSTRGLEPCYEQVAFPQQSREGTLLAMASGQGLADTVKIHQDATIYVSLIGQGDTLRHRLSPGRRAYVFVIEGAMQINGTKLEGGDQARIEAEAELVFDTSQRADFIVIDLP